MIKMALRLWLAGLILGMGLLLTSAAPAAADFANSIEADWVVSPDGPLTSIAEAVERAAEGDTIAVYGGYYDGPLVVSKSLRLVGYDWPVIDGHHHGSVVELLAPNTRFEGFQVQNSGASLNREDTGIVGAATNLTIVNNRLENVLFGIYLLEAHGAVLQDNKIWGMDLDVPRRGDAIRIWYSHDALLQGNVVDGGRDVVLWYSERLTLRENVISNGRYGLHFMYCHDAIVEHNLLSHNSVGAYLMYSHDLHLRYNTIAFNRGPSGYGIGLKDMDAAVVEENLIVDNRVGAFVDNSPASRDSIGLFKGNIFALNDIGLNLMPSVQRNRFVENSFVDNQEQVSIAGGGRLQGNLWTVDGRGNYWSDYAGYDAAGDGLGDIPYRADRLFESLTDRQPQLRLFLFSPTAQAVDFAARAFPFVRPQPKLEDERPLMSPVIPEGLPPLPVSDTLPLGTASAGLLTLAAAVGLFLVVGQRSGGERLPAEKAGHAPPIVGKEYREMIQVTDLTKRFGKITAVDALSFTVSEGEAVALWGPNGAGKTTALRCLLGVIPYRGMIQLAGLDTALQGRTARRLIGFVPQELNFHDDMTVQETLLFYARLKKTPATAIPTLLERLGLALHHDKDVRNLSGGLKQRLALAVALLADPPLLMLDEPTANLDAAAREDFLALLERQKQNGKTLIFSSHRAEEVIALADRVLVLEQGRLVADCPPAQLNGRPGWKALIRLRVDEPQLEQAIAALQEHGFQASRNGAGLKLAVSADAKAFPISLLAQAGIMVHDFEEINDD